MKIYTKTGDEGTTALYGGTRVSKYSLRLDSYGTIDELNAHMGLIRDQEIDVNLKETLLKIQTLLFTIGAILATDPNKVALPNGKKRLQIATLSPKDIEFLEDKIDEMETNLAPMTHFILPGGHQSVSFCHIARCICRRAERLSCALYDQEPFEKNILKYLNRLSDYLFVLARKLSFDFHIKEIKWIPEKK